MAFGRAFWRASQIKLLCGDRKGVDSVEFSYLIIFNERCRMHRVSLRAGVVRLLIVVIMFSGVSRARAQSIDAYAGAVNAMVWTGLVVVGVGVYFIARAPRTTGCVVRENGGLALESSKRGDPGYLLEGKTDALHEGERVKVIGRRHEGAGHRKVLRVKNVAKDYGPCPGVASVGSGSAR